ncbi:hypothetical protein POPTR_012G070801v4 [Populus trichocarpa]|uniref:Secreted protein n=1 Tax=Populus trichocarpa TaxID=3694 RepID=A0A3N7FTF9_POPTR|nr:hypothetical protein POPTR_012G070801v4 [Populus trichocarpa]
MPLSLCFSPLPLHLCFLSFSQWSSCGWNPVNVVCFSVFYSLWQTPYALRFRMLFVALFVTLSLQSLCYRHACMPVICFRQGDVFHMEVDYAGLALQLNGDSVLLWLQNTFRWLASSRFELKALIAQ